MSRTFISENNRPVLDVVNIIAGIALVVSPWFLGYASVATAAWHAWAVGAVIALIAAVATVLASPRSVRQSRLGSGATAMKQT